MQYTVHSIQYFTERDRGHESEIDEVLEYAKNEKTQEMFGKMLQSLSYYMH